MHLVTVFGVEAIYKTTKIIPDTLSSCLVVAAIESRCWLLLIAAKTKQLLKVLTKLLLLLCPHIFLHDLVARCVFSCVNAHSQQALAAAAVSISRRPSHALRNP